MDRLAEHTEKVQEEGGVVNHEYHKPEGKLLIRSVARQRSGTNGHEGLYGCGVLSPPYSALGGCVSPGRTLAQLEGPVGLSGSRGYNKDLENNPPLKHKNVTSPERKRA